MSRGEGWAVFFDAVGTLIHPEPDPITVYQRVARSFGSKLDMETIASRFRHVWRAQEELDARQGWRTDEEREERRWRTMVAECLPDVSSPEDCFLTLYQHFARPESWRIDPAIVPVLESLAEEGYQMGICSNFDRRLRPIVAAMPELNRFEHLVISSEVGWRKPAREFFHHVQQCVGLDGFRIFVVGDDRINDYDGAFNADLTPILLNAHGGKERKNQIDAWDELVELMQSIMNPSR